MKQRFFMLVLLLSVCLCLFFSSYSVGLFLPQRFAAAQTQWQASSIRDYEIVVGVFVHLPTTDFGQYRIVVHDRQVVEAGRRFPSIAQVIETPPYSPASFTPVPLPQAEPYTLDAIMNVASQTVGNAPIIEIRDCNTYWDAEYDSQYGYVTSLRFHCGGGFLTCQIGDCGGGYTVLNFTPLP